MGRTADRQFRGREQPIRDELQTNNKLTSFRFSRSTRQLFSAHQIQVLEYGDHPRCTARNIAREPSRGVLVYQSQVARIRSRHDRTLKA